MARASALPAAALDELIRELEATPDELVETNQGTYGDVEACRKVGTGDPRHANRDVYQRVNGTRYSRGPDEADAPGRMRVLTGNLDRITKAGRELDELVRQSRKSGGRS